MVKKKETDRALAESLIYKEKSAILDSDRR